MALKVKFVNLAEHAIQDFKSRLPDLPPLGMCLYCRRKRCDGAVLTREHILPDGLGGDLVIPEASCEICQKKIHGFETSVLNGFFGIVRAGYGIRSRKRRGSKNKHNDVYKSELCDESRLDEDHLPPITGYKFVPLTDVPKVFTAEIFQTRPTIISGSFVEISPKVILVPADARIKEGIFGTSFRFKGGDFSRELAKIAHGFTVAKIGIDGFSPLLNEIILIEGQPNKNKFIGSRPGSISSELHKLSLRIDSGRFRSKDGLSVAFRQVLVVDIQFFCQLGSPIFEVVVGIVDSMN